MPPFIYSSLPSSWPNPQPMLHSLYFFLLPLLLSSSPSFPASPSPSPSPSPCPLLSFLQTLSLPPPWNETLPPCRLPGVSCNTAGDIVALNLSGLSISTPLAAAAHYLVLLPSLRSLDLYLNHFTGTIPSSLFLSLRLRYLDLGLNFLEGPIPSSLFLSLHLRHLDLGKNFLNGTIPKEISFSVDLEYLSLYGNFLTGDIPPELALLPNLRYIYLNENNLTGRLPNFPSHCSVSVLYLYSNILSGPIPTSLFNCHNLTDLALSFNRLGGSVPDLFDEMPALEHLFLVDNGFVGEIPRSLGKLANLTSALLAMNHFNGSVPEEIGGCRALESLIVWGNQLSGTIPSQLGKLGSLTSLILAENQLVGPVPAHVGNCSSLEELKLHENFIAGPIPSELAKLRNLKALWLFDNLLEGTIPPEIGKLSALWDLQLYNNCLTGTIPSEITHLRKLQYLSLAHNNLTGQLPSDLGRSTENGFIKLDLTGNDFYGPIPSGLCSGNNLTNLGIGKNRFNDSFPVQIARCSSLRRVILSKNHLQGIIPENLSLNSGISYLDLSNNLFEGQIPQSFALWHNLTMLDISINFFSGPIPDFSKLSNLRTLQLSSNRLTGTIPPQLANCVQLLKLDISQNLVSGSIPLQLVRLEKLIFLILSGNRLTGHIPDGFTSSQDLLELQLGKNLLEGSIPYSLGNLQYITVALNLSNNKLTGEIPSSLSTLDKLEILDLSGNSLTGHIPSGLTNMVSLSFVNVSFNKLSGILPASWVKFAASSPELFMGNPDLCIQSDDGNYCQKALKHRGNKTNFFVLFMVLLGLFLLLAVFCAANCFRLRYCSYMASNRRANFVAALPEDLTYEDIIQATEGLSEKYVIGRGRYGTVYKIQIGMGNHCWAIKKVDLSEPSFSNEMKILNLVRHRNLVRMAGYCIRDGFGMIVYEYIFGGSLFDVLHQKMKPQVPLEWEVRHRIALGIAQALSYLHHDCVPQVIHRDLKSSNILLDSEMEPKIGDFGISKLMDSASCSSDLSSAKSSIVGTLGYIAPENGYSTRLNEKIDVFSYGVVVLELLCRKMSVDPSFEDGVDIVTWMNTNLQNAKNLDLLHFLDEEIWYWMDNEKANALKLLELAMWCAQSSSESRPSMREVVGILMKLKCYLVHFHSAREVRYARWLRWLAQFCFSICPLSDILVISNRAKEDSLILWRHPAKFYDDLVQEALVRSSLRPEEIREGGGSAKQFAIGGGDLVRGKKIGPDREFAKPCSAVSAVRLLNLCWRLKERSWKHRSEKERRQFHRGEEFCGEHEKYPNSADCSQGRQARGNEQVRSSSNKRLRQFGEFCFGEFALKEHLRTKEFGGVLPAEFASLSHVELRQVVLDQPSLQVCRRRSCGRCSCDRCCSASGVRKFVACKVAADAIATCEVLPAEFVELRQVQLRQVVLGQRSSQVCRRRNCDMWSLTGVRSRVATSAVVTGSVRQRSSQVEFGWCPQYFSRIFVQTGKVASLSQEELRQVQLRQVVFASGVRKFVAGEIATDRVREFHGLFTGLAHVTDGVWLVSAVFQLNFCANRKGTSCERFDSRITGNCRKIAAIGRGNFRCVTLWPNPLPMLHSLYFFLLFPLLLSSSPSLPSSASPSASPLLPFLRTLSLPPPWNETLPPCRLPGVSCTTAGDIVALNLSGLSISTPLSAAAQHLVLLPSLRSLDLSLNHLTGNIPSSLFLSLRLRYLHLGQNFLSGPIPKEISFSIDLEYLYLYKNLLTGDIPPELTLLPNLRYLYLNENNLTGGLPNFPSHCSVSVLYLHWNFLSGPIPTSLFNCHDLTELVLSFNRFEGSVPDLFDEMSGLELLYLDDNGFVGEIPRSLGKLGNLTSAMLSKNHFIGSVPGEIGGCRALKSLNVWGNHLSGTIPSQLGKLGSLKSFSLADNQLVGPLPAQIGNCSSLEELELQDNLIAGPIPSELAKLKNLKKLWLFNNLLEGTIPPEIGKLRALWNLQLYNNRLTGTIPSEITQLQKLQCLSLAHNNLTGQLPSDLGRSTESGLIKLDLTGNHFYGPIPSGLCSGNNLTVLVIGQNRFNDSFPVQIARCSSLRRVILSKNHLQGIIPESLSLNSGISYLDLSNNLFEGQIPQSLALWHNLTMLDISINYFSGSIPDFSKLSNLRMLQLSSNRLTGTIPPQLANCVELLTFNISQNLVSGSIPLQVLRLEKLKFLILSGNRLTGHIPDVFSSRQDLLELQLGKNLLEGSIPYSLGNLQYITVALNLSNNRLTGEIPSSLSKLDNKLDKLEILDLSGNSLTGQIPSELTNLVSLSFVNVSFNKLSGILPASWVKFAASSPELFMGNPVLCIQSDDGNYCQKAMKHRGNITKFFVLFMVLLGLFLLLAGFCAASCFRSRYCSYMASNRRTDFVADLPEDLPEDLTYLTYEDIMRATEGLSEKYVIGRGRYGTVYKTQIGMRNHCWAVKKVDLSEPSFSNEMKILNLVRHRNLVRMAGYCIRNGFGMIVYDYMLGGSLFDVLHQKKKPQVPLDWEVRHRMALGIAQGLSYLHHDCVPQVIHRDLKSSNILLDSEMEPKIGDFGTSKLMDSISFCSDLSSPKSSIVGTLGYIAPENGYSTRLNEKSDVFSYGVVLLELLCRKMSVDPSFEDGVDIVTWMDTNLQNAKKLDILCFLDEEIWYWMDNEKACALKLLELAMSCTQSSSESRPSMREVVGILMKLWAS
ncbi:LOW QUALITY PROTEIN: uncharacterized protein LOC110020406 [Phalaenopsis equestris]|uniref:LOW QUALITY PROTEIN: uncharacterized protein LOC110020406 n=2 Tax=Phalaenopsis equestris TaxID=78828 RepID=UPI0009E27B6D|nr:LOW QUALITY PROTEIN: uncharacterized protein LOC110020406 [Phalaenopsis equestris]